MIDTEQIYQTLDRYFHWSGYPSIDPITGEVDISGDVNSLSNCKRLKQLPVRFSTITSYGNFILTNVDMLKTLDGCPREVHGNFIISGTNCRDLKGAPQSVGNGAQFLMPQLQSLEGLPAKISQWLDINWQPRLPLLRILLVRGLEDGVYIKHDDGGNIDDLEAIINRYLNTGRDGIIPCAAELHKAGYGGNAKL